jgi:hypothetical protein
VNQDGTLSRITHTWQNTPLSEVLRTISLKSKDYHIHCIYDQLDSILVSADVQNMTVTDAVNKVTKDKPVKVKQKNQDIFVQFDAKKAKRKMQLHGVVLDSRSHTRLPGATVQLLREDSTVIIQRKAGGMFTINDRTYYASDFHIEVPQLSARYILCVSHVGYQTSYTDVIINNPRKRDFERNLGNIYLKEDRYQLKEVTVTGSRVMFYHRGDTLVFNASAFQLAEGSMLDALIKQLPGVELKEDGRIYHNGQFVEGLLLNGKDFFRGNNQIMLDNLPAYIVKEVKIYDKYGHLSEFLGEQHPNDKRYVMDVQLKREYRIGWMSNLEIGAGPSDLKLKDTDRYLARLFALRHTDHSKVALVGNVNNLNDTRKPGETSTWKPTDLKVGRQIERMAGVDYDIEERDGKWTLHGEATLTSTDLDEQATTERINYLGTGDIRDHEYSDSRNKFLNLYTWHDINWKNDRLDLTIKPKLTYNKTNLSTNILATTVASNDSLLNRQLRKGMTKGYNLETSLLFDLTFSFSEKDYLLVSAALNHESGNDERYNRYAIDYGNNYQAERGNQYYKDHPNRKLGFKTGLTYSWKLTSNFHFRPNYTVSYEEHDRKNVLYLLDRADSLWEWEFGTLPSQLEYEQTLDRTNSYDSHRHDICHTISPAIWYFPKVGGGRTSILVDMQHIQLSQHLHYQRGGLDTLLTRRSTMFQCENNYLQWQSLDGKHTAFLCYRIKSTAPDLTNLVDIRDATDPTNIQEGSSDLKNTYHHNINLNYRNNQREHQRLQVIDFRYNSYHDAVTKGYRYNPITGVRTWKSYNVDGNWDLRLSYSLNLPLGKARHLKLGTTSVYQMVSQVSIVNEQRNKVSTNVWKEDLNLKWTVGKHALGLRCIGTLWRVSSPLVGFEDFSVTDISCCINALIRLPLKMELSTDFTAYTRHGYTSSGMNGTDLVWNARLTYPLKGQLLLVLDGFDILGKLSNVTRIINAQSRTESLTNTLPSYVLFHVIWRLNKKHRKNNGDDQN